MRIEGLILDERPIRTRHATCRISVLAGESHIAAKSVETLNNQLQAVQNRHVLMATT